MSNTEQYLRRCNNIYSFTASSARREKGGIFIPNEDMEFLKGEFNLRYQKNRLLLNPGNRLFINGCLVSFDNYPLQRTDFIRINRYSFEMQSDLKNNLIALMEEFNIPRIVEGHNPGLVLFK